MLKKLLLFVIIITALGGLPTMAQSDDGWFTGRLFAYHLSNGGESALQVHYAHLYNIDNRFSIGVGYGCIFDSGINIPLEAETRVYLLRNSRLRMSLLVSGGYVFGYGVATISPRIGIEAGKHTRFRFAADAGCAVLGDVCMLRLGAGVVF